MKYKTSTKLVYVQNHADINSERKKMSQSTISDNFNLKHEDKELDSLIQLYDCKNNILHVEKPSGQFHKSPEDITDKPGKSSEYELVIILLTREI